MSNVATAHPDTEQLRRFGLGELAAEESRLVENHVADCDACAAALLAVPNDTLLDLLRGDDDTPQPDIEMSVTVSTLPQVGAEPEAVPQSLRDHPRYRVVRPLGHGGMGSVFEATHQLLGRAVALKVIKAELLQSPDAVQRFEQEMRAVARLSHPNIVQAHDAERAGETHFLVMEFVEGLTLADHLKAHGPLPITEACGYVRQAALALQHAFEQGLTHRDVKPQNLMLTPGGQVKVLDFGLARVTDDGEPASVQTRERTVMGTADYIAPEQGRNAHAADTRSDIYSLGCTLYHLLTGRTPYPDGTHVEKIVKHLTDEPTPAVLLRPDLPPGVEAVLAKMLAKKPADRYQTPTEVAAALEPFCGPTLRPVKKPRRKRRLALAGVALGLLLSAALAGAVVLHVKADDGREITIETTEPDIELVVRKGGAVVRIIDPTSGDKWDLDANKYDLAAAGQPDGLRIALPDREPFVFKRGDKGVLTVTRGPRLAAPGEPIGLVRRIPWPGADFRYGGTAFSADGRYFLAGDHRPQKGVIRVYEVAGSKIIQKLTGFGGRCDSAIFLGNSEVLSESSDKTIRRWDLRTGEERAKRSMPREWAWFPAVHGSLYCTFGETPPLGADNTIRVFQVGKEEEILRITPLHPGAGLCNCAAFTADGKQLVTVDNDGGKGVFRFHDLASGHVVRSWKVDDSPDGRMALTADGRQVWADVGFAGTNTVGVVGCDVETGKVTKRVPCNRDGPTDIAAFSPDGRFFGFHIEKGRALHFVELATGKEIYAFDEAGNLGSFSLSFAPDGRHAIACGKEEIFLFRLPDPPKVAAPKAD